jgi:glucitol operon activator protein
MAHKLVIFLFALWILQGVMTYWQIKNYRKTLTQLKNKGKVYVGHEKGKFKAGSIVLIAVDDKDIIIDMKEMKGFTVFDRFKTRNMYIGKTVEELVGELTTIEKDTVTTKALKKAFNKALSH